MKNIYAILFSLVLGSVYGQQTVGLFQYTPESFNGYTLFSPLRSNKTFLINNCGQVAQSWDSNYLPSQSSYLLDNGHLLRAVKTEGLSHPRINAGGGGERVQEVDESGQIVWDFVYFDSNHRMHHDVEPLPNGNVLILAWEYKSQAEALAAGRNPAYLPDLAIWPEMIIEVEPEGSTGGKIVWEWHLWDHLIQEFSSGRANFGVVKDHPELMDLNFVSEIPELGDADWLHLNSIDYNPELDQILFCSAGLNEIYIIDHSTTSAEAAGHSGGKSGKGGDFLYRWGNPISYQRGTAANQRLYEIHDAHWIPQGLTDAGKILLFNNGRDRPGGNASSVDLIAPPMGANGTYELTDGSFYGPLDPEWRYQDGDWYSSFISGSQRLPNGNTLICSGAEGRFFEITPTQKVVWEYINPETHQGPTIQGNPVPLSGSLAGNIVFRATRYAPEHPGIQQLNLTPGAPIEPQALPSSADCEILTSTNTLAAETWAVFPNPSDGRFTFETNLPGSFYLEVIDLQGKVQSAFWVESTPMLIELGALSPGLYFLRSNGRILDKLVIQP